MRKRVLWNAKSLPYTQKTKKFSTDKNDENIFKLYHTVRDHWHYTAEFRGSAHSICNLRYKTPKKNSLSISYGSTYDYKFMIINHLAKEFDGQFECLGENTEKYITFSVPTKKQLDNSKTIRYKLKFIDSFRFVSTTLSSLVDNLSEKLHSDKFKDFKSEHDYISARDNQLNFQCLECKKNYNKDCNKELIKRIANTYEFYNGDINKLILLLRKGVHPYEYMDSSERFDDHYQIKKLFIVNLI